MKRFLSLIILTLLILVSCSNGTSENTDTAATSETPELTDTSGVNTEIKCEIHHDDYHMIPFELLMYVGIDTVNEWAAECQTESADAVDDCPYGGYNIKAFIDKFDIPREVFAAKADLAHYATYDCEMLYTESAEDIELYFSNRTELQEESIKVQNFAFLEHYFVSQYTNTVMDMIVADSTGAHGSSPSIPQIVQAVGMERSELEKIILDMNDKTLEVCGKVMVYDYDLDLIYNEDGSFKELPVFEDLTAYESVQKYDSLFCRRGE